MNKLHNTGRTWWKSGHIPWNKGLRISLKPKTGKYITCINCGKEKYFQLNELKKRERKYCSLGCDYIAGLKEFSINQESVEFVAQLTI